jgi:hypothetical protein
MGRENTDRYIRPSERKHRVDDLHQSKVTKVRTCGKNVGRKKCEESVLRISQKEEGQLKSQERYG